MANTLTVSDVIPSGRRHKRVRYKVVLSGSYVQAVRGANTGEVLVLTGASNGSSLPGAFWGIEGPDVMYPMQGPAGYTVKLLPGADAQHWLLQIFSAVGTELVAGAYPAAITGDTNDFYVEAEGKAAA